MSPDRLSTLVFFLFLKSTLGARPSLPTSNLTFGPISLQLDIGLRHGCMTFLDKPWLPIFRFRNRRFPNWRFPLLRPFIPLSRSCVFQIFLDLWLPYFSRAPLDQEMDLHRWIWPWVNENRWICFPWLVDFFSFSQTSGLGRNYNSSLWYGSPTSDFRLLSHEVGKSGSIKLDLFLLRARKFSEARFTSTPTASTLTCIDFDLRRPDAPQPDLHSTVRWGQRLICAVGLDGRGSGNIALLWSTFELFCGPFDLVLAPLTPFGDSFSSNQARLKASKGIMASHPMKDLVDLWVQKYEVITVTSLT